MNQLFNEKYGYDRQISSFPPIPTITSTLYDTYFADRNALKRDVELQQSGGTPNIGMLSITNKVLYDHLGKWCILAIGNSINGPFVPVLAFIFGIVYDQAFPTGYVPVAINVATGTAGNEMLLTYRLGNIWALLP